MGTKLLDKVSQQAETKMKLLAVIALVALLAGCSSPQATKLPCGDFDTDLLRADLQNPLRIDRQWHETLILNLAWQLDCERRQSPKISEDSGCQQ